MNKKATICFRTNEELKRALERLAKAQRRSLSSIIDNILHDKVQGEREGKDNG